MGLRGYRPPSRTVRLGTGKEAPTFEVRGLNLEDLSFLVQTHFPDLGEVVDLYLDANGAVFSLDAAQRFMLRMIQRAPILAANVIAVCVVGEDGDLGDLTEDARLLPAPVQTFVLNTILELTTEDMGGPKAALALLGEALAGLIPEATKARLTAARATNTL